MLAGVVCFAVRLGSSPVKDGADAMGAAVLVLFGCLFAGPVLVVLAFGTGWSWGASTRRTQAHPLLWKVAAGVGSLLLVLVLFLPLALTA